MNALLLLLALFGHLAVWVAVSNRIGSTRCNYRLARWLRKGTSLIMVGWPLLLALSWWDQLLVVEWWMKRWPHGLSLTCYATVCWLYFGWVVICWCCRRLGLDCRVRETRVTSEKFLLAEQTDKPLVQDAMTGWLSKLPGNQVLALEVNRKQLAIARCPAALSGLTITHFSDIHISSHFTREFYEQLVGHVNKLDSQVIAITGDLVDLNPVPGWVFELYGQLAAPRGVYFILGNHDFRNRRVADFRQAMVAQGLIDLGTQAVRQEIVGKAIDFLGNECPWSGVVPVMGQDRSGSAFSIALAHSPDQFRWAQQHQVDLLLAGHMHGGQICFPAIGPTVAPSRHGVTFSAGCFRRGSTTMHVSRGSAGLVPLRWNCRPEITQLEIRQAT